MKTKLPSHLFTCDDGGLYDTRSKDWAANPLRKNYSKHHREIETLADVKATLRAGQFAWLGGYQLYLLTDDAQPLCFACAEKEFRQIACDFLNNAKTGWRIAACDINYEDGEMACCHCSKQIPASYSN